MNEIKIRKAKRNDLDQVYYLLLEMIEAEDCGSKKIAPDLMNLRIRKKDFEKKAKEELLKEFSEKNSIYLVAEVNNEIRGYLRGSFVVMSDAFFETHKVGFLNALVVSKKHNGKGIASKLNADFEEWLKNNDCKQIHLEVFKNNPADKIYKKWGYQTVNKKMFKKLS